MIVRQTLFNFTAVNQTSNWLRHDIEQSPFDLSLAIEFGTGLAGTIAIDYIVGNLGEDYEHFVSISQTTTVITVTDNGPNPPTGTGVGHGLAVGDMVNLRGSPGGLEDGLFPVASITSPTVYTLTSPVSQSVGLANAMAASGLLFTGAASASLILLAPVTARAVVGVTNPIWASRMRCTAFTTGGIATLVAMQASHPS